MSRRVRLTGTGRLAGRAHAGFTAVELATAGGMLSLIGGLLVVTFVNVSQQWTRTASVVEMDNVRSVATSHIRTALRQAGVLDIQTHADGHNSLRYAVGDRFDDLTGAIRLTQERRMDLVGEDATARRLVVLDAGGSVLQTLATGVLAFTVADQIAEPSLEPGELAMTLRLSSAHTGQPFESRFRVWLRNRDRLLRLYEAEDAAVEAPCVIGTDAAAHGGRFAWYPDGATENGGRVTFTVAVPRDGTYRLWMRSRVPSTSRDQMQVQVEGAAAQSWTASAVHASWTWELLDAYPLAEGSRTIRFTRQDLGPLWDAILVTDDDTFVPDF